MPGARRDSEKLAADFGDAARRSPLLQKAS